MNNTYPGIFPDEEFEGRLQRLREKMDKAELDVCVLSAPENVCYLTGLNHWGYFGLHVLVVPREGQMYIVARSMERILMNTWIGPRAEFRGYKDGENPGQFTAELLKETGHERSRVGMDMGTVYRSYRDSRDLVEHLPEASWQDCDDVLNKLRYIKSPLEITAHRQAAMVSERMVEAALRSIEPGVNEKAIAAEVCKEMILAGGEPPSFGPFLRPRKRLGEEHSTWSTSGNAILQPDDLMFVELAASISSTLRASTSASFSSWNSMGTKRAFSM